MPLHYIIVYWPFSGTGFVEISDWLSEDIVGSTQGMSDSENGLKPTNIWEHFFYFLSEFYFRTQIGLFALITYNKLDKTSLKCVISKDLKCFETKPDRITFTERLMWF